VVSRGKKGSLGGKELARGRLHSPSPVLLQFEEKKRKKNRENLGKERGGGYLTEEDRGEKREEKIKNEKKLMRRRG